MTDADDEPVLAPHEVAAHDVEGFLFWRAALRWQRQLTAVLKPLELTPAQFILLSCARRYQLRNPGLPTQRELADLSGADAMMTSQVINALVKRGLLARRADPNDKRVWRIDVTPDGIDLAAEAATVALDFDVAFFAPVGERGHLLPTLRLLADWDPPGG